jgi:succinate-semialdehyde dehydrogenase/glutarate-semialdehyde dehydrogenase
LSSLKPASATPLGAAPRRELELEAGLPAGWLNVLVGPAAEIGDAFVEDERVKLITFTGSGEVGWKLRNARRASASSSSSGTRPR